MLPLPVSSMPAGLQKSSGGKYSLSVFTFYMYLSVSTVLEYNFKVFVLYFRFSAILLILYYISVGNILFFFLKKHTLTSSTNHNALHCKRSAVNQLFSNGCFYAFEMTHSAQ